MCDECRQRECHGMCPNAGDEKKAGECSYCANSIYESEEHYIIPGGERYHRDCLFSSLEFLDVFELAELFGFDESIDEDAFVRWYEKLTPEDIAEKLGAVEELGIRR